MRLSAQILKNFQNLNSFDKATEWNVRQNEANTLYFQLIDLDQDGLRYIPTGTSVSVNLTFPAVNPANVISKAANQVSALDKSLWSVNLTDLENPYSGNVQFSITQDGVTKRFTVQQAIVVELLNQGGC